MAKTPTCPSCHAAAHAPQAQAASSPRRPKRRWESRPSKHRGSSTPPIASLHRGHASRCLALTLLCTAPFLTATPQAQADILDRAHILENQPGPNPDTGASEATPTNTPGLSQRPYLLLSVGGGLKSFTGQALLGAPTLQSHITPSLSVEYQEATSGPARQSYVVSEAGVEAALLPTGRFNPYIAFGLGHERWTEDSGTRQSLFKTQRSLGAHLRLTDRLYLTIASKRNDWLLLGPGIDRKEADGKRRKLFALSFSLKI